MVEYPNNRSDYPFFSMYSLFIHYIQVFEKLVTLTLITYIQKKNNLKFVTSYRIFCLKVSCAAYKHISLSFCKRLIFVTS